MKNSLALNFFLFIGFLVIGYTVSTRFDPSNYDHVAIASSATNSSSTSTIPSLNNGQRSMLLIGVDTVETSKPQLQSLWLVSYLPSDPTLYFLPIYPSGNELLSERDLLIVSTFSINRLLDVSSKDFNLVPSEKFVKLLEKNNYWWSGYFIYDQSGLENVLDLLGIMHSDTSSTGNSSSQGPSTSSQSTEDGYTAQLSTIQTICQRLSGASQAPDFTELMAQLTRYLMSNLEFQQIMQDWDEANSNGARLNCTFPTLQVSTANN